ncbi:MAG: phage tail protein [Chloroflexaceae bacterium]|nr:phage tail protein [Chloroflexaceae bacterium]
MDVNQTTFHLLHGRDDWERCTWSDNGASPPAPALEWDCASQSLRLAVRPTLFRPPRPSPPLAPGVRRGAGRDRYGNWYWIDANRSGLRWLPNGEQRSRPYWLPPAEPTACEAPTDGSFASCEPTPPPLRQLAGLAVTTQHYMVVGDLSQRGLLVFDLHGGGAPLLLRWPDTTPFAPWDIAPTPDGGVLLLDRTNQTYWALDAHFRLLADLGQEQRSVFQPTDRELPRRVEPRPVQPHGYPLSGMAGDSFNPLSIEVGPAGSVLILDTPEPGPGRGYSRILVYRAGLLLASYSLENAVTVADDSVLRSGSRPYSVLGHDMAYLPPVAQTPTAHGSNCDCGCGGTHEAETTDTGQHVVYVADIGGNQVFAFTLETTAWNATTPPLLVPAATDDYLPLRRWGGKALVAAAGLVFYDFADRWVPLVPFVECNYEQVAVLTTPLPDDDDLPGQTFDSQIPGCVWHRLLLDAQIPPGSAVQVRARAADDPALLPQTGWLPQPTPYMRGDGAELPYYDPWADRRNEPPEELERTGTWELLFQEVRGRYIQLELTIRGSGRTTPALRALRAWFRRFSYSEHYLPAIYREEPVAASFIERFLANFEGTFTSIEEKIQHVAVLFDARTVPPDALDWLACWLGVAFDPLWSREGNENRRRFFLRHADRLFRMRGTVAGLLAAVQLYLSEQPDLSLFDPRCQMGRLRLVERFRTRGIGGLAFGDASDPGASRNPLDPVVVRESAHRFTLLVPHDLSADDLAMVTRIAELEKPAHTACDIKRYWDMFRVGEARLGLDTVLGESARFLPHLLGANYLSETYLEAPYPFNLEDRLISDRDMLGALPPL